MEDSIIEVDSLYKVEEVQNEELAEIKIKLEDKLND